MLAPILMGVALCGACLGPSQFTFESNREERHP